MWSSWVQGNSNGPLVPMVQLVPIEKHIIPMVLLVNVHLIKGTFFKGNFLCDITGYRAFLTVHCSEESQQLVMDLHLRGFKRILLLTAKAWISSTTTFNKDGELRGTTSKTVRSSTNLMRAPQL